MEELSAQASPCPPPTGLRWNWLSPFKESRHSAPGDLGTGNIGGGGAEEHSRVFSFPSPSVSTTCPYLALMWLN